MLNSQGKWFTNTDTFTEYATAQTDTVVFTPPAGRAIRLLGYTISTTEANTITIKIGTTTVLKFYFGTNGGANFDSHEVPIVAGLADQTIKITSSSATPHSVAFYGFTQ